LPVSCSCRMPRLGVDALLAPIFSATPILSRRDVQAVLIGASSLALDACAFVAQGILLVDWERCWAAVTCTLKGASWLTLCQVMSPGSARAVLAGERALILSGTASSLASNLLIVGPGARFVSCSLICTSLHTRADAGANDVFIIMPCRLSAACVPLTF